MNTASMAAGIKMEDSMKAIFQPMDLYGLLIPVQAFLPENDGQTEKMSSNYQCR